MGEAMLPYAFTIFLSAFLLFQVQPLIGKFILPWFGGSPGVWTTCLLFFQTLLLGGYAYAHFISTRLKPKQQALVHLGLLALALCWLPIVPDPGWKPAPGQEPVGRILLLLLATLGMPYLILSATGPLLQRWFSLSHPGVPPYRLYSLSNVGSLLALLSYPFVFEPWLTRAEQGLGWSWTFGVFVLLCGVCAWQVRRLPAATAPSSDAVPTAATGPAPAVGAKTETASAPTAISKRFEQVMWIVLPAIASLLLLATTNKLCLDVAVVPFLWVIPLSLYLLSFILCFDHPRWYSRRAYSAVFAAGCGLITYFLTQRGLGLPVQVTGYSATLFAGCMICHGELYRLRPDSAQLTRFYLYIAAGGALGSLAVAVLAPLLLDDFLELEIGLTLLVYVIGVLSLLLRSRALATGVAAGVLAATVLVPVLRAGPMHFERTWVEAVVRQLGGFHREYWKELVAGGALMIVCLRHGWRIGTGEWRRGMSAFPLLMALLLGMIFTVQEVGDRKNLIASVRNFYGTLKLREYNADKPDAHFYLLSHGETTHGLQFVEPPADTWATSYYGPTSGVGRLLDSIPGPRHIGLVGLGAGTLAVYGHAGDTMRFYDINPAVVPFAEERFSYLRKSAADVKIVLGDARLVMEEEVRRGQEPRFDVLVLDAFSSDAIPVHLLTREAMGLYLKRLKPNGVLAVHISNRYLRLGPVVDGLAQHYHLASANVSDDPSEERWWLYGTSWVLLSPDAARLDIEGLLVVIEAEDPDGKRVEWTDDHASLMDIIR